MGLPDRHELRVGDAERQAVVDQLRVHLGAGRLTMDEFEERTGHALAARTVGELVPLTADLPAVRTTGSGPPVRVPLRTRQPAPTWDVVWRIHVGLWLVLSVLWIGIWTAADFWGPFWPIYPVLGFGVTVGIHAVVRKAVLG